MCRTAARLTARLLSTYALLSMHELAERLVTLGPAGANAVEIRANTMMDLIARRRRDDEMDL